MPASDFGRHRTREDEVAARSAYDLVAIAHGFRRGALGVGRAHRDFYTRGGPTGRNSGRVQFAATSLDVGEIAPRQHMDPTQAALGREVANLVENLSLRGVTRASRLHWSMLAVGLPRDHPGRHTALACQ